VNAVSHSVGAHTTTVQRYIQVDDTDSSDGDKDPADTAAADNIAEASSSEASSLADSCQVCLLATENRHIIGFIKETHFFNLLYCLLCTFYFR